MRSTLTGSARLWLGILKGVLNDERLDAAAAKVRNTSGDAAPLLMGLMLAEEVGDAVQQLRRFFDPAVSTVALDELGAELADVVLTVSVLARLVGVDLTAQLDQRLKRSQS